MKITLVRHGETIENQKQITQGQLDGTLNSKGNTQAMNVAEILKDKKFTKIYSSDLARSVMTAVKIRKYHPETQYEQIKALREINFGDLQGKKSTVGDSNQLISAGWENFVSDVWNGRVSGGESNQELQHRVFTFINNLLAESPNGAFLLVTHGGPMRHIKSVVEGLPLQPLFRLEIPNGAIWEYKIDEPLKFHEAEV